MRPDAPVTTIRGISVIIRLPDILCAVPSAPIIAWQSGVEPLDAKAMAKNRHRDGPGPSQRQLRVGELIRRTLSDVLMRGDIHDPDLNRLSVTVGEVRASPDLKVATAFVLPLGGDGQDEVVGLLAATRANCAGSSARSCH